MTETNELIAEEAKALAKPAPVVIDWKVQVERVHEHYRRSFDPYKDKAGQVVWFLTMHPADGAKAVSKWFRAAPVFAAAVQRAGELREKIFPSSTKIRMVLVLEGRRDTLSKLATP